MNSNWIIDLNVKLKNFQNKTGENIHDLELGEEFLDMTPKAQYIKERKSIN